jgi:hypothetical protein
MDMNIQSNNIIKGKIMKLRIILLICTILVQLQAKETLSIGVSQSIGTGTLQVQSSDNNFDSNTTTIRLGLANTNSNTDRISIEYSFGIYKYQDSQQSDNYTSLGIQYRKAFKNISNNTLGVYGILGYSKMDINDVKSSWVDLSGDALLLGIGTSIEIDRLLFLDIELTNNHIQWSEYNGYSAVTNNKVASIGITYKY